MFGSMQVVTVAELKWSPAPAPDFGRQGDEAPMKRAAAAQPRPARRWNQKDTAHDAASVVVGSLAPWHLDGEPLRLPGALGCRGGFPRGLAVIHGRGGDQ